ncbi:DUF5134 domain-containing protein [Amycolatopsis sp. NBRC 101858]|uniref:DUF5134 domain-containing protein n=1 Tax=Amycolatopsis sp. NBRC 101858 TaxID=3032200 RepID=UPI0024A19786|nr:DUF5134 domain-containing protein [Amycolatopsis sp. NBRC 101858]GLY42856.1 DUF5134 domain-containing protein [Amycolatopsis sp. NBRC 101858]
MITAEGLRWILTAIFAATGAFCAYRCLRQGTPAERTGDVLHVVMCVAMVAMAWPATMSVARWPQTVFFAAAAVWFVGVAASGTSHADHGGPRVAIYHVVMMGAMAWMVFVMPRAMDGMTGSGGTMDMPGHEGMLMPGAGAAGTTPADVTAVALVLVAVFVVAGLVFLSRAIDDARASRPPLRSLGSGTSGVMALGMALMLLTMA